MHSCKSKKFFSGFTLIELLVVISIIGVLSSMVLVSTNTARSKTRYAQAYSSMKAIADAAEMEHNLAYTNYAPDVGQGIAPRFVPAYLSKWPTPPCPGWNYDWENWSGGADIRISLRKVNVDIVYYYCITTTAGCINGSGASIENAPGKVLTCNE